MKKKKKKKKSKKGKSSKKSGESDNEISQSENESTEAVTLTRVNASKKGVSKKIPAPGEKAKRVKFYVTVKADGIGGDTGWGILGPETANSIAEFSEQLDATLAKFYETQKESS